MIKDVAVADVVMPDQAAADLGHHGYCRGQLQELQNHPSIALCLYNTH